MADDGDGGGLAELPAEDAGDVSQDAGDGPGLVERSASTGSWLRDSDAAFFEEDEERNAAQAERNLRIRDLLRKRRKEKEEHDVPPEPRGAGEDFMLVSQDITPARKVLDESHPPWFLARPFIDNVALRLHEELLDFVEFMKPTREEVDARRSWVRTIAGVCKTLWPACEIRVFGSFSTGLSLPNADVDVAIMNLPCKPATAMKILADTMLAGNEISWLEIIESAKVPVMKIRSRSCGLRADIVVNQQDGLNTSKFIKDSCAEFPQLRPLLIFIKYFLLQRGLNDTFTGGMGSYLLCSVVLHFLQRHPSLRDRRLHASTSLGHLLFDFMKYYGRDFRYDVGISVLDGGRTFRKEEKFSAKGKGKGGVSLCLESPLGATPIDLGAPCFRMHILRNLFHHGFHCISHLFVNRASAEDSLLCPLLLDPAHGVITERYSLMTEQPMALASMRSQDSLPVPEDTAAEGEPAAKRARVGDGDAVGADAAL